MPKSAGNDSSGPGKYAKPSVSGGTVHGAEAFQDVDPLTVHTCLCAVLMAGDGILLGTTRDGGAVVIQMFSGDATDKLYASTALELEDVLQGIQDVARGEVD